MVFALMFRYLKDIKQFPLSVARPMAQLIGDNLNGRDPRVTIVWS